MIRICIIFGILHFVAMTCFALGPELTPLMVYIVDYPIAWFTFERFTNYPNWIQYGIPIVICSVLYPTLLFMLWIGIKRFAFKIMAEPVAGGDATR